MRKKEEKEMCNTWLNIFNIKQFCFWDRIVLVSLISKDEKKRRKGNVEHLVKYFGTERKQQM